MHRGLRAAHPGNVARVRSPPLLVLALLAIVAGTAASSCVEPPDRTTLPPVPTPAADADGGGRSRRVEAPVVVSWTGPGLDGTDVTVRADDAPPGVTFVRGRPSVLVKIDHLARAGDCRSLGDQYAFWRFRSQTDPEHADVAGAFARRAADVAAYVGCDGVTVTANG